MSGFKTVPSVRSMLEGKNLHFWYQRAYEGDSALFSKLVPGIKDPDIWFVYCEEYPEFIDMVEEDC